MAQVSRHTGFGGSALTRLLAQWVRVDVGGPPRVFSDQLSDWLSWTDAVALSAALERSPAAASLKAQGTGAFDENDAARVRAQLVSRIIKDIQPQGGGQRRGMPVLPATGSEVVFSPYRQTYLTLQHAMGVAISALRGRLRAAMVATSPGMQRLAALDAVMGQVLAPREQSLLSKVPEVLAWRFSQLRETEEAQAETSRLTDASPPGPASVRVGNPAWLNTFLQDLQAVLLAELELRFQPVEGLMAALRTQTHVQHEPHE